MKRISTEDNYKTDAARAVNKTKKNKTGKLLRRQATVYKTNGRRVADVAVSATFANPHTGLANSLQHTIDHELKRLPVTHLKIASTEKLNELELGRLRLIKELRSFKELNVLNGFLKSIWFQAKRKKLSESQIVNGLRVSAELKEKLKLKFGG